MLKVTQLISGSKKVSGNLPNTVCFDFAQYHLISLILTRLIKSVLLPVAVVHLP